MKLNDQSFDMVKDGSKTLEIRINDEKRQKLQIGDQITFTNNGRQINTKVTGLFIYDSFVELLKSLNAVDAGWSADDTLEKMITDLRLIYSKEEEQKFGVVGISLELL